MKCLYYKGNVKREERLEESTDIQDTHIISLELIKIVIMTDGSSESVL